MWITGGKRKGREPCPQIEERKKSKYVEMGKTPVHRKKLGNAGEKRDYAQDMHRNPEKFST